MANKQLKNITFHLIGNAHDTGHLKDALGQWRIPCAHITHHEMKLMTADVTLVITDDPAHAATMAKTLTGKAKPYAIVTGMVSGVKKALKPLAASPLVLINKGSMHDDLATLFCHLEVPEEAEAA